MRNVLFILILALTCLNAILLCEMFKSKDGPEQIVHVPPQFSPIDPEQQPDPDESHPDDSEKIPDYISVQKHRPNEEDGSVLGDVLSHSQGAPFGNAHGRATNAHETTHGINSELRNANSDSSRVNGFYVLNGLGCIVEEPGIKMSDCRKFLPENIRSYRFKTYLEGEQLRQWDSRPLYICDEWIAYINGAETNVDDVKNGRYKGEWTDGVSGCLDFSIYTLAMAMAVHEKDQSYWEENEQFRKFILSNLKRARDTYMVGHQMKEFAWEKQDKLLNEFLHSNEAESMRNFVRDHFEGVWLDARVMTPYFERKPGEEIQLTPICPHHLHLSR